MMRRKAEVATRLLSTPIARSMLATGAQRRIADDAILAAVEVGLADLEGSKRDALWKSHRWLVKNHRNHQVYVSALVRWLAPGRDRTVVPEVGVSRSIVDVLVACDDLQAFEIKSDLDDFARFQSQFDSYRRVANRVSVVTTQRDVARLELSVRFQSLGLAYLDTSGSLVHVRAATADASRLDPRAMIQVLRRDEYVRLLQRRGMDLSGLANTRIFVEAVKNFRQIDPEMLQCAVAMELRNRRPRIGYRGLRQVPRPIVPSLLALNPGPIGFSRLRSWLNEGVQSVLS